uniref:Conopeptide n=1 Tax=Conus lenavati TaxID=1519839 RepID=A0A0K8TU58_CONLV
MNRMGFFLMLTAAVLLTSLICTAAPADEAKMERNPEKRCVDCRPGYQCCGVCTGNHCTGQEIPKE